MVKRLPSSAFRPPLEEIRARLAKLTPRHRS